MRRRTARRPASGAVKVSPPLIYPSGTPAAGRLSAGSPIWRYRGAAHSVEPTRARPILEEIDYGCRHRLPPPVPLRRLRRDATPLPRHRGPGHRRHRGSHGSQRPARGPGGGRRVHRDSHRHRRRRRQRCGGRDGRRWSRGRPAAPDRRGERDPAGRACAGRELPGHREPSVHRGVDDRRCREHGRGSGGWGGRTRCNGAVHGRPAAGWHGGQRRHGRGRRYRRRRRTGTRRPNRGSSRHVTLQRSRRLRPRHVHGRVNRCFRRCLRRRLPGSRSRREHPRRPGRELGRQHGTGAGVARFAGGGQPGPSLRGPGGQPVVEFGQPGPGRRRPARLGAGWTVARRHHRRRACRQRRPRTRQRGISGHRPDAAHRRRSRPGGHHRAGRRRGLVLVRPR